MQNNVSVLNKIYVLRNFVRLFWKQNYFSYTVQFQHFSNSIYCIWRSVLNIAPWSALRVSVGEECACVANKLGKRLLGSVQVFPSPLHEACRWIFRAGSRQALSYADSERQEVCYCFISDCRWSCIIQCARWWEYTADATSAEAWFISGTQLRASRRRSTGHPWRTNRPNLCPLAIKRSLNVAKSYYANVTT